MFARNLVAKARSLSKNIVRNSSVQLKPASPKAAPIVNVLEAVKPGATPKGSVVAVLTGKSSYPQVPLSDSFVSWSAKEQPKINEKVEVTVLENGMRVVSVDSQDLTSTVGVYVDAGSRNENDHTAGVTHVLEHLALQSTTNRSQFRIFRDASKIGANLSISSGREGFFLSASSLRDFAPEALGLLADGVQNYALIPEEVSDAVVYYGANVFPRSQQPAEWIVEALHRVAFKNQPLGQSLYAQNPSSLKPKVFKEYLEGLFTPKRTIVTAVGVDHAELVALTRELFDKMPADQNVLSKKAEYVGGDARLDKVLTDEDLLAARDTSAPEILTHIAIGFKGAAATDKDSVAEQVLAALLGNSSNVTGTARLNKLVNGQTAFSASSFLFSYSDAALFGLYGTAQGANGKQLLDALVGEAKALAGSVSVVELTAAKRSLKTKWGFCENKQTHALNLARDVAMFGQAQNLSSLVDQVTADDLRKAAQRLLKSKPTVAVYGNATSLPDYSEIAQSVKL